LIERTSVHYGCRYGVFKVPASSRPHYERTPARRPVSQNSTAYVR